MFEAYEKRMFVIVSFIILVGIVFISKLFYIQVKDDSYKLSADNNSRRYVIEYPSRGLIYDRDGNLLVYNEVAYDIMLNPRKKIPFDTLQLCSLLQIDKSDLLTNIAYVRQKSPYRPYPIFKQVEIKNFARFQEYLYKFECLEVQRRTIRRYKTPYAAHVLGYVGEVSESTVKKKPYYKSGDYIGISGVEKEYEEVLRGKKGNKVYLVDVFNQIQGSFKNGAYDTLAVAGRDIHISLDMKLQEYCETLMQNKKGAIVAIEPATGEILALVSSPTFDPNLLVGSNRSINYPRLMIDPDKPLYNRATMARYPPGSTFKMVNALICLQNGTASLNGTFPCHSGFHIGNFSVKCHHGGDIGLVYSIQSSCNAYYCNAFWRLLDGKNYREIRANYDTWLRYLNNFGIGKQLETDLGYTTAGFVPTTDYFDRFYGRDKWKPLMLVSMSIGQGELGLTPLQLANMTAAIANKGYYYTPHIIRQVDGNKYIDARFRNKNETEVEELYFRPVIDGMELVLHPGGTATGAYLHGLDLCGKTGTAQNPHGDDHSIFVAFAPKHNPKIALSVYIENGGFGASWAAPIASLAAEKYLRDSISRKSLEKQIIESDLIERNEQLRLQRQAAREKKQHP